MELLEMHLSMGLPLAVLSPHLAEIPGQLHVNPGVKEHLKPQCEKAFTF
jgi:hypothetical protein